MEKLVEKSACCGCEACYNVCPKNAISMVSDDKGFKYPKIDEKSCINCNMCKNVCPVLNKKSPDVFLGAYACYNKNEDERLKSSSGGIFILLAREILKKGGVVFGASLSPEFRVEHIYVDKEEELKKLLGSKYVQSNIGDCYRIAKKYLNDERYVLFSGTPCQIEGLKSYLGKEYERLYCQDIICHGVPSPKVWEEYKKLRKELDKKVPKSVMFRNKDKGWDKLNIKFEYEDTSYSNVAKRDLFFQLFLNDIILRDSCYDCKFKGKSRNSDITLADYWGIDKVHLDMYDNKGASLVTIQSTKGKELFNSILDKLIYKETKLSEAIKYNPLMVISPSINSSRYEFFDNLGKCDFEKLAKDSILKGEKFRGINNVNTKLIKEIYDKLLDDTSRNIFSNRLLWEFTGDKKYIRGVVGDFGFIKNIVKNKDRNMVIFGAGNLGKSLYKLFDNIEWKCFVDNLISDEKIYDIKVISAKELKKYYEDVCAVITPKNGNKEIYSQLLSLGFEENSLINMGEYLYELEQKRLLEIMPDGKYKENTYFNIINTLPSDNFCKEFNGKSIFIETNFEIEELEILEKLKSIIISKKVPFAICIKSNSQNLLDIPKLLLKYNPSYNFLLRNYSLNKYDTILYAF